MAKIYKFLVIFLVLLSWPLNLYLANTHQDFLQYLTPLVLITISFFLYINKYKYCSLPSLLIPVFEPKLAIFPVLFVLSQVPFSKDKKISLMVLALSLILLAVSWKPFWGQTIFTPDYQARQEVLRNIHLYPTPFLARMFQNKVKIIGDKFTGNLFALTDPNNYFFAFHPREITVTNQNLDKYPFLALAFLLVGIYFFAKNPYKRFILASFFAGVISLSLLTNFDRQDFILWLPISLVVLGGIQQTLAKKNRLVNLFAVLFIVFAIIQFLRNYLTFT